MLEHDCSNQEFALLVFWLEVAVKVAFEEQVIVGVSAIVGYPTFAKFRDKTVSNVVSCFRIIIAGVFIAIQRCVGDL